MAVLIRIAFRNMWEHKSKSLIIGGLLGFGVLIIILGSTMIDSASEQLKEAYIDFFTGNMMISGESETAYSIFGMEAMASTDYEPPPVIPDYENLYKEVAANPKVKSLTSLVSTFGILSFDEWEDPEEMDGTEGSSMTFTVLFGVDFDSYFRTFPGLSIVSGSIPEPGSNSIIISEMLLRQLKKKYNREFQPGDDLLVTGITGGMRIRQVKLAGVYRHSDSDRNAGIFSLLDVNTARMLAGLIHNTGDEYELDESQTALLGADNYDDLFGFGDEIFGGDMIVQADSTGLLGSLDSAASLLGDTTRRDELNKAEEGAWHFLLIKLHNPLDTYPLIREFNAAALKDGRGLRAVDWKAAAGTAGKMADFMRMFFVIAIMIIAVVGVIIIMNTLVISVIERTGEIGTMRALGAKKSFIRAMFLTETLTQSVFFGSLAALLTVSGMAIVNAAKIPLENSFAKLLLGGDVVHLVPSLGIIITTIIIVFLVGWLAHIYPVSFALKIQPVKAMQTE